MKDTENSWKIQKFQGGGSAAGMRLDTNIHWEVPPSAVCKQGIQGPGVQPVLVFVSNTFG